MESQAGSFLFARKIFYTGAFLGLRSGKASLVHASLRRIIRRMRRSARNTRLNFH